MIYAITAYGDAVLKQKAKEITQNEINTKVLAEEMFATMSNANGVGLAAPQIGKSIRMFVMDSTPIKDDDDEPEDKKNVANTPIKQVFINPIILREWGEKWAYEEGCLSIPGVRGDVYRHSNIRIQFFDENWIQHTKEFDGFAARIIQHEFDHIEGILFVDYFSPLKKQLLKNKLSRISKGITDISYRMKFPSKK